jgi:hypothetical protein
MGFPYYRTNALWRVSWSELKTLEWTLYVLPLSTVSCDAIYSHQI